MYSVAFQRRQADCADRDTGLIVAAIHRHASDVAIEKGSCAAMSENGDVLFTFPEDARWNADQQAVEFEVEIGERRGGVKRIALRKRSYYNKGKDPRCVKDTYEQVGVEWKYVFSAVENTIAENEGSEKPEKPTPYLINIKIGTRNARLPGIGPI